MQHGGFVTWWFQLNGGVQQHEIMGDLHMVVSNIMVVSHRGFDTIMVVLIQEKQLTHQLQEIDSNNNNDNNNNDNNNNDNNNNNNMVSQLWSQMVSK